VNIDLFKGAVKKALGYGLGNALNTAALILLLPTFVHLSGTNGYFSAQGMLIAQVASIFGSYTFSLTIPRTLEILNVEQKKILYYELFIFQIFIGIFGIIAIYLINRNITFPGFCSYLIVYSSVVQWQWLHIANKKSHVLAILLLTSRMAIIILEIYALNLVKPSQQMDWLFSTLITVTFCLTIFPTIRLFSAKEITKNILKVRFGILIIHELKKGRHLFFASLLTSIYSLGPSVIVSQLNPSLLVLIQQFDRIRLAVSNASGMLLGAVYPLLIGASKAHLMGGFKILQRYVLIPITTLNLMLFFSMSFIPVETVAILTKLQMTVTSLGLALIAGFFATSSNVITLTFLHPIESDRFYLITISIGALLFLVTASLSANFLPLRSIGICLMLSVVLVELMVNIFLWSRSRSLLAEYACRSTENK
jgi:hypothetical protein